MLVCDYALRETGACLAVHHHRLLGLTCYRTHTSWMVFQYAIPHNSSAYCDILCAGGIFLR